ncbi:MAG: hypothetical protein ACKO0V_16340 [bacterium]
MLARHAARAIAQLGVDARRGDAPRILVTAGSASAAAQLRARVLAAHRRWSLAARLPAWVDSMELPRAVERIRALRKAGGFGGYLRVMVDEAQELDERWLRWLVGTALDPDDPRRGVMLCVDPSQRLVPGCVAPSIFGPPTRRSSSPEAERSASRNESASCRRRRK